MNYYQREPEYNPGYAVENSVSYHHDINAYDDIYIEVGQIRLFGWMYDLAYKTFETVHDMIAPGRDINMIVSPEEPEPGVEGCSYVNTIIIYPLITLRAYPSSLWNTSLICTVCHELYHCVLEQDNFMYDTDGNYNDLIEAQTNYMAITFMANNRSLLENRLCIPIDIYTMAHLYSFEYGSVFCKDMSNIQYMSPRDVWIKTLTLGGDERILSKEDIEAFDNTDNINVVMYSFIEDDNEEHYIPEEWDCVEDEVKKDGKFTSPCKDILDMRIQSAGSINITQIDKAKSLIYDYDMEEDGSMTIYVGCVSNKTPFFIKHEEEVK